MDSWPAGHLSPEVKLELAKEEKLKGNDFYGQKLIKDAIRHYHKSLLYIKAIDNDGAKKMYDPKHIPVSPVVLEENQKLKVNVLNNLSACLLQKPETDLNKVVGYCDQILQVAPSNDKAFFRKAQALFRLNDVSGALASCLEAAKLLNTTDPKVESLISQCKSKMAQEIFKEKGMYAAMLGFK